MKDKLLFFSIITIFVASACGLSTTLGIETLTGSGNVIKQARDVSDFNRVQVCCGMVLNLVQGGQESLEIEADDNFTDEILTTVQNGSLTIEYQTRTNKNYRPSQPVQIYLSAVDIQKVSVSGGGRLITEALSSDRFDLELSGGSSAELGDLLADLAGIQISGGGDFKADSIESADFSLDLSGGSDAAISALNARMLNLEISGGGEVVAAGTATEANIDLSGSSSFEGQDLLIQNLIFSASGGGRSTAWVEESLGADLSGGSSLGYYGYPDIPNQRLSGGSKLNQLGEH